MRAVVQRVSGAVVRVNRDVVGAIKSGLLIFIGIHETDTQEDLQWMVNKIIQLRIFEDEEGRMNRSVVDIKGDLMVISQFTVYGNVNKGTRPSFNRAAPPEKAIPFYEEVVKRLSFMTGRTVATGRFGEHMEIVAHNDGPVTLIIDSHDRKF